MRSRSIYPLGAGCIAIGGLIAYLHSTKQYLSNPLMSVSLYLALGIGYILFISRLFPLLSQKTVDLQVTSIISLLLLSGAFAIYHFYSKPLVLVAVAGCSFLLPIILFQGWCYFKLAFEPVALQPWSLPVPYVRNNAISLHLNSIHLTFKIPTDTDATTQNYSITAPGIKPLGSVFSDLIFDEKYNERTAEFLDIKNSQYGWLFYAQASALFGNRPLDATLSLIDNRLKDNTVIVVEIV